MQPFDTDSRLIERMTNGDHDAFAEVYDRYASLAYAVAVRVLQDSMAAEDVVSEVFLRLWRNPGSFDEQRGKLAAWLTVITRNRAVDALRKRRGEREDQLEDAPPAQIAIASNSHYAVDFQKAQKLMAELPAEQRRALELAYLDGFTQSEISEKLGQPLGTVKSRIRNGLLTLKKAMA
ncbi:MAG: sigma-70 family RNA polymerase sigma factor [Terriglobales bacterium]